MNEDINALLQLNGTQKERDWLQENMETLSVRERTILAAVFQQHPPASMAEVISHMLTLDEYEVRYHAGNCEQLGEFCMRENCVPEELRDYVDTKELGMSYADEHPGVFLNGHYIEYPKTEPFQRYDGKSYIPKMTDWSVRLKLASEQVPDGLWVKLPDYSDMNDEPGDIRMTLDALQVRSVRECTLLDAKCILPEIGDIVNQYNDLIELIYDGQNLGCLLDEQGQGMRGFDVRFAAAMEYENCHQLRAAVNIAQDLDSYEYVPTLRLHDYAVEELQQRGLLEKVQNISEYFDYEGYAVNLLEQQGYMQTSDGLGFVLRFGKLEQTQSPSMTMQ